MKQPLSTLLKDPYVLALIVGIAGLVGVVISIRF